MDTSFVYSAIVGRLASGINKSPSGWNTLNCIMCHLNGEPTIDTKRKAGIKLTGDSFTYNCFRCAFKAHWRPGQLISVEVETLLEVIGLLREDISRIKIKALQLSSFLGTEQFDRVLPLVNFSKMNRPKGFKTLTDWYEYYKTNNIVPSQNYLEVLEYLKSRGKYLQQAEYFWTDDFNYQLNKRLIIPFYYNDTFVGYTARYANKNIPKSVSKYFTQCKAVGFLFNNKYLYEIKRKYVVIVEGPLDALSINGVAYLKDAPTAHQIQLLNSSGKDIILVTDRALSGMPAIKVALENNWFVSFPNWEEGIKDAADATKKYGPIWTTKNILDYKTDSPIKINTMAKIWMG